MGLTLAQLEAELAKGLPADLVKKLLAAYEEIKENFYLGRHEPSELNAGKLCEIVARILEHESGLALTPWGKTIPNLGDYLRGFEKQTQANDSIRFHIPRVANAIYNIRNKRGVGHVGGDVNPNLADSTYLVGAADWILADLIRLHYGCSLEEAQAIVDGLVQRKLPLVYEIGGVKRVLNPSLDYSQKTLLLLAGLFPKGVAESDLFNWVEHSHASVYRRDILRRLHKRKLIEFTNGKCTILPPGLREVELNYAKWSDLSSVRNKPKPRGKSRKK